jgi:hypothetical protein
MLLSWFAYAIPAVSVALGGVFAFKSLSALRQSRACAHWPSVPGWVVRAQVTQTLAADGEARFSDFSVLYTYRVNDQDYRGTRLHVGDPDTLGRVTEETATKYRTGTNVTVYYNPENPEEAVLEPASFRRVLPGFAAASLAGIGLLMLGTMTLVS